MSSPTDRGRVLIVDDNLSVLDLLVELLNEEGYDVSFAVDGEKGLALAVSGEPDLIVSDVVMPVVDGLELCRRLKENPRTEKIPVLLISGIRRSEDDGIKGLYAGADDYLDLPFRNDELLVKVARLVERHRIERHYREIVEHAVDIIYTRDMEGTITSVNTSGARFFGRTAQQLVGMHLQDMIGSECAERDILETKQHNSPEALRTNYCLVNSTGERRHLEGMVTVQRDRDGRALGVRGVVRDVTDQIVAQEALRESEERYRQLVELSPDAIIVHSEGKFNYLNPAALKLWGATSQEDLIGKPILSVVHPDYHDIVKHRVRQAEELEIQTPLIAQKHVRLNGEVIDVEVTGIPITANGKPAVQSVFRDITASRQAEASIRESEERYRELFENANDIIYTHDLAGNFTSFNRAGEQLTGYSREETATLNVVDVIAPEYLQFAREMLSQRQSNGTPKMYELDIITKDGRRVRLEVSTRVIYRNGRPVGVQGIGRDLTERKSSERALLESQAFFNSFMNNSPAVAFMKDAEGCYVYVNKPFERLFNKPLSYLKGRTSHDWLPEKVANRTHRHDLQILRTLQPDEIVERVTTEDGTNLELLVFKFPMVDAAGNRYVAGVGVDISERRRAEEKLAQQAKREAMSHSISQAIRCSLDSHEIYQTAVRELGSYLNVDRCSLFIRNDRAACATNVAEYHADGVVPAASDFALSHLQALVKALDETGVLPFSHPATDERISQLYETILSKADVKSIMYVGIRVGDEVRAAFALSTTREVREWSEADIEMAKAVADQTGIAIRQAELYQKAETTSVREALVNRLTMAIRASLSLPEVLSSATRELGRALSASRVHLYLYDTERSHLPLEHEYLAPNCESVSHVEITHADPIGQRLIRSSQPIIIDDALNYSGDTEEFNRHIREHAEKLGLRSQISYPLIVKGQFRGVLCIHQTDRIRHWSEDELSLVEALAERLAIGIAQAELFEMVARGKTEWETTFDAMSDGIFIFDREGELKRVNRAGAAMEALHPRLLLGRKCCDILRASDQASTCIVEQAIADCRSVTIEITPARLNRPLLVTIEPVLDEANRAIAVVCTARDLSELRKVQAVAREHQSLLNNILESARESIYAVDNDGCFKWCNSATLKGLGYQRSDFIGRHLLEMVYEGDRELVHEKFGKALTGAPQTYEMRYFAYDGRLRYARVDNSPLVVEGRTTGVLGIARDITGQKEERERAARADKLRALGQLASGVAHDFNNSLAAILGRTQLLRRQVSEPALSRNLDIIQTAAEDAAATVRRIQTFARKSPVKEFELLDVGSLLNDAVEITRTRWENEARLLGFEYDVVLDAQPKQHTYGSASELREVFVNLIVNSVDAMPRGGKLQIGCRRSEDRLQLIFADNGMGMADDVRQKIFEPFFSTKGAHGTGLGLSVSYSIIERHGGSISVVSEPGNGTAFTIDLPAAQAETSTVEVAPIADAMPSLNILVIDDEVAVRETLAEMLMAMNHQVTLAESGQRAIEKIVGKNFDLVFTDLAMPEMDGWETARAVRRYRPDVKIVLVTGYGPTTRPPEGEEDLVDGIIGKPFDFSQVGSILESLWSHDTELLNVR